MKKFIQVLLIISLFLLTSCSVSKPPKIEKIKEDMVAEEVNIYKIDGENTYFNIVSAEIIKRKTDGNKDRVYLDVVMENDYYKLTGEYLLYYNLYDVGGWCLDNYNIEEQSIEVKKSPLNDETFIRKVDTELTDIQIKSKKSFTDDEGIYVDEIYFSGEYNIGLYKEIVDVKYTNKFYNSRWFENFEIISKTGNWDNYIGNWDADFQVHTWRDPESYEGTSADLKGHFSLTVEDVQIYDDESIKIDYYYDLEMTDINNNRKFSNSEKRTYIGKAKETIVEDNILNTEVTFNFFKGPAILGAIDAQENDDYWMLYVYFEKDGLSLLGSNVIPQEFNYVNY